ncbi:Transcription factor GRAS [Dillenia turbinata]|uniref:Transcription factor GRAS n=1 Tax=Dillenia turbinata TaxID=194707 RepID=A0AAN8VMW1_9MAGN
MVVKKPQFRVGEGESGYGTTWAIQWVPEGLLSSSYGRRVYFPLTLRIRSRDLSSILNQRKAMVSFENLNFGCPSQNKNASSTDPETAEGNWTEGTSSHDADDWQELGRTDFLPSDYGHLLNNSAKKQEEWQQSFAEYGCLDYLHRITTSPLLQKSVQETAQLEKFSLHNSEPLVSDPLRSLNLLIDRGSSRFRYPEALNEKEPSSEELCSSGSGRGLSTSEILRVAGTRFIQSFQSPDELSMLFHPFGSYFAGLSDQETQSMELAQLLLSAAEKIGHQQFDRANYLLEQCEYLTSKMGNPVQRLVYYFCEALRERIDRETGRIAFKGVRSSLSSDIEDSMMTLSPTLLAYFQVIPFGQIAHVSGIQPIIESVTQANRVHLVDLGIRSGVHWTIFMQALASRSEPPIDSLTITAIGTKSKGKIEETGARLAAFARRMNLPFSLHVVMVSDMVDLNESLLQVDAEEVAVFSPFSLKSMISQPTWLESLMRVLRNINPCIMVVSEVEANHNSRVFGNRSIESLFHFGDDPNRLAMESTYCSFGIRNIEAAEGGERTVCHVKIEVWRAFFARFGVMGAELSMSTLYQASLIREKFACGSKCTLDMDEKCLLVGWRGTPIISLSAWKFF